MNDVPKDKYRFLDLIITLINALSMVLIAIFILSNVITSLIFVVIVVLITLMFVFYWTTRNPFKMYLLRAFAFNNLFFIFMALLVYYSLVSPVPTSRLGFSLLLLPPIFYLIFSFRFSYISKVMDKRTGTSLAMMGRTKAAERYFIKDSLEIKKQRKEAITKLKEAYPYKILIVLPIVLTLNSFYALSYGFL